MGGERKREPKYKHKACVPYSGKAGLHAKGYSLDTATWIINVEDVCIFLQLYCWVKFNTDSASRAVVSFSGSDIIRRLDEIQGQVIQKSVCINHLSTLKIAMIVLTSSLLKSILYSSSSIRLKADLLGALAIQKMWGLCRKKAS